MNLIDALLQAKDLENKFRKKRNSILKKHTKGDKKNISLFNNAINLNKIKIEEINKDILEKIKNQLLNLYIKYLNKEKEILKLKISLIKDFYSIYFINNSNNKLTKSNLYTLLKIAYNNLEEDKNKKYRMTKQNKINLNNALIEFENKKNTKKIKSNGFSLSILTTIPSIDILLKKEIYNHYIIINQKNIEEYNFLLNNNKIKQNKTK